MEQVRARGTRGLDRLRLAVAGTAAWDTLVDQPSDIEETVALIAPAAEWEAFPRSYRIAKRVLDIVVASLGLVLIAPLMLVIAAMIRLDSPGPAIFRQERIGQGGRRFQILKFRTMVNGCDLLRDGPHKRPDDARVTRVGRLLRRTSLDELPQLINVLRGEMSLVGPRPELPEIVDAHYEPWQYRRFLVPQGITGWWQVTGRGKKLMYEHTEDDLYYIENASFRFDLLILAKTVVAVLRREGAF